MPNPYHYGSPVTGDQFAGRHAELRALTSRMRDGINVVVVSPRRFGKTSLLQKAAARVENSGGAVISVSAMGVADVASFATQLLAATYRAKGGRWHRTKQAVPEFLRSLRVTPSVTFDGEHPSFSLEPSSTPADLESVITDVYQVLDELSEHRPAVLIVDEFQDVLGLGDHLPALFKSLADRHPRVSLVVAGSKRHVMGQLVLDETAPLYGMTSTLALAPIPPDVMSDFLVRRAVIGEKDLPVELADLIVALAGPVPNDIQRLAYEVFDAAGGIVVARDVETGFRLAIEHEADFHAWRFEGLAVGQRRVLHRLAVAPTSQPYSADFRDAVGLRSSGAVRNALTVLDRDLGLVTTVDGEYRVTSPFLAAWLRARP